MVAINIPKVITVLVIIAKNPGLRFVVINLKLYFVIWLLHCLLCNRF